MYNTRLFIYLFLADRTATQYDWLFVSLLSVRPSVRR